MEPLKPYIWANEATTPKVIQITANCSTSNGNFDYQFLSSQSEIQNGITILVVKYQLVAGSGGVIKKDFQLTAANNYTNQNKVKIIFQTAGANPVMKGMCVAQLNSNGYSANPCKPFCWIRKISGSNTCEVFFKVTQLTEDIPASPSSTQTIAAENKVILYYDMIGGNGGDAERSYNLSQFTAFPIVEIQIRDSARTIKKGGGTTDQEDADSS